MNKVLRYLKLLALITLPGCAAQENASSDEGPFIVGGTPIAIPAPSPQMSEVGFDLRVMMESFIPTDQRLVAAFLPEDSVEAFQTGKEWAPSSSWAVASAIRIEEFQDVSAEMFGEVVAFVEDLPAFQVAEWNRQEVEESNDRLRPYRAGRDDLEASAPRNLGRMFFWEDAVGYFLLQDIISDGVSFTTAEGVVIVRVKDRFVLMRLGSIFEGVSTIAEVTTRSESWASAVLSANAGG